MFHCDMHVLFWFKTMFHCDMHVIFWLCAMLHYDYVSFDLLR